MEGIKLSEDEIDIAPVYCCDNNIECHGDDCENITCECECHEV